MAPWQLAISIPAGVTLIAGALAWQPGTRLDDGDETLSFIQYALDRSREFEISEGLAAAYLTAL